MDKQKEKVNCWILRTILIVITVGWGRMGTGGTGTAGLWSALKRPDQPKSGPVTAFLQTFTRVFSDWTSVLARPTAHLPASALWGAREDVYGGFMQYCPFVHTLTYHILLVVPNYTFRPCPQCLWGEKHLQNTFVLQYTNILAKLLHQKTSSKNNCENK